MTIDGKPLNPTDLRVLSGVEERDKLKPAMLITNIGNTPVTLSDAGYQNYDLPKYALVSDSKNVLTSGEQVLLPIQDEDNIINIKQQLTTSINVGEDGKATVFAVTTKGKRFEIPTIIKVAE